MKRRIGTEVHCTDRNKKWIKIKIRRACALDARRATCCTHHSVVDTFCATIFFFVSHSCFPKCFFVIVRCEARKKVFTTLNLLLLFGWMDCSCLKLDIFQKASFHSKWILMLESIRCTHIVCSLHSIAPKIQTMRIFFYSNHKRNKIGSNRQREPV